MNSSALEGVLRRDRAIIIGALAVLTALCWLDVVRLANDMWMGGMDMTGYRMIPAGQGLMMPPNAPWQPIEFGYVFVMWVVMMIGMMTPSAAPAILIYARIGREAVAQGRPFASATWFAAGYLLAWTAFSIVATSAQWALQRAALLTRMMAAASATFVDHCRSISMDAAQGCLPILLPVAVDFHVEPRRFSRRCTSGSPSERAKSNSRISAIITCCVCPTCRRSYTSRSFRARPLRPGLAKSPRPA
jgi:hypothetical protein